jgi:hypothetical protein
MRVISISKIKNISAMEKKCTEYEIRGLDIGSNPHSNGDVFSRLNCLWLFIIGKIFIIKISINKTKTLKYKINNIILSKDLLVGS